MSKSGLRLMNMRTDRHDVSSDILMVIYNHLQLSGIESSAQNIGGKFQHIEIIYDIGCIRRIWIDVVDDNVNIYCIPKISIPLSCPNLLQQIVDSVRRV